MSNYKSNGVDFDNLFDLYLQGPFSALSNLKQGGADLNQRYANVSFGKQGPNTNYKTAAGHADVATLWAQKGTATYLIPTPSYNGQLIETTGTGSLSAFIVINPDGTWSSSDSAFRGYWYGGSSPTPGIGSNYQLLATVGAHAGTVTNPATTYTTISSALTIRLTSKGTTSASVQLQIRAVGATSPASSGTCTLATTNDGSA